MRSGEGVPAPYQYHCQVVYVGWGTKLFAERTRAGLAHPSIRVETGARGEVRGQLAEAWRSVLSYRVHMRGMRESSALLIEHTTRIWVRAASPGGSIPVIYVPGYTASTRI